MKSLCRYSLKVTVFLKESPVEPFNALPPPFKFPVYAKAVEQRQQPFLGQWRIIHVVAAWEKRVYQTKNKEKSDATFQFGDVWKGNLRKISFAFLGNFF